MKIFSAEQIRACDAQTIEESGISSIELMERAAGACVGWMMQRFSKDTLFIVLCGTGNNGGDGLAITRLLNTNGYAVKAFLLQYSDQLSKDCNVNLKRLRQLGPELVEILQEGSYITDIPSDIIIIDAIFGTGLNRPLEGWVADFIDKLNNLPNQKIAIDMPSGMAADSVDLKGTVLAANDTLSFQFHKRSFLHPETGEKAGRVHILDIGLDAEYIGKTQAHYYTVDTADIVSKYKPRDKFSHKGNYGDAFMIGGSYGMMGAIILATKAVMRAGAGKVKALIPDCGYIVMQTALPEAMCTVSGEGCINEISGWEKAKAIGIGPGIGTDPDTVDAVGAFLEVCKQPLVIDADALNIIAKNTELLGKIPEGSILTPHPKEFERMFGKSDNSMAMLELARTQAMRYNIYIVLKGHHTVIITPEGDCHYNMNGNAGMATGGSGDVLCGLITGLMAQGYESKDAAIMGVYLHGMAGDLASVSLSQEAMIASDITRYLGASFLILKNKALNKNG